MVAYIAEHPWVAGAHADPDGSIVVWPDPGATESGPRPGPLVREHLDHWAEVYDWVYQEAVGRHSDDLDLSGWRASDTGLPLPVEHMRDWLTCTIDLVLAQRPVRVLEIGCGTGLLAHRLHPHLDGYVGTDVASAAVQRLGRANLPRTAFVQAAAHETVAARVRAAMDGVFGGGVAPDCVLLNSVTQCFPGLDYLAEVLRQALDTVADGGTVIVGDIRHSDLLTAHFTWLEQVRDPGRGGTDLEARVRAAISADEELSFAPRAVAAMLMAQDRPVRVSLHARPMEDDTELTRYRYDLILHVGPGSSEEAAPVRTILWPGQLGPDVAATLRGAVADPPVVVSGIPNALLDDAATAITPYALRQALRGLNAAVLLDPHNPRLLAVAAPAACGLLTLEALVGNGHASGSEAHEPLAGFVRRRLPEVLRDHLRRQVPGIRPPRIVVAHADADADSGERGTR
ncbi:class I SAM-dependent methyltransferase [Micromonospora sp. NPDC050276]|uniref:class I SAM-dependent methyltransferase n=1 Tax=Micromonospora sp. NPDC050276 TaxID=3364278 RepID=UPI0037B4CAE7